jgi:hypothetical protein
MWEVEGMRQIQIKKNRKEKKKTNVLPEVQKAGHIEFGLLVFTPRVGARV